MPRTYAAGGPFAAALRRVPCGRWRPRSTTRTGGAYPTCGFRSPIAATSAASTACPPTWSALAGTLNRDAPATRRSSAWSGIFTLDSRDRGGATDRRRAAGAPRFPRLVANARRDRRESRSLPDHQRLPAGARRGGPGRRRDRPGQCLDRSSGWPFILRESPAATARAGAAGGLEAIAAFPEVRPVKVNAVAMRGFTEDEAIRFAEFARSSTFQVRFIEFMPLDGDHAWTPDSVLTGEELRAMIRRRPSASRSRASHRRPPGSSASATEGGDRLHQPGLRALLRGLQPDPPHRRGQAADLPLLAAGDRPARPAARGRGGLRARAAGPRRGLAQGAEAPRRRAGLPTAAEDDERDRGVGPVAYAMLRQMGISRSARRPRRSGSAPTRCAAGTAPGSCARPATSATAAASRPPRSSG